MSQSCQQLVEMVAEEIKGRRQTRSCWLVEVIGAIHDVGAKALGEAINCHLEQGLKGGRVGAVSERIQQGAGFGRDVGWFSTYVARLTVRTPSGSSKRRVQDVSGQCHVAVPAAGSYLAV